MRLLLLLLLVVVLLLLLRRFFFAACPSLSPVLRCSFCLVRMSRCATRLVRQKLALDSSTPFNCMFVFRVCNRCFATHTGRRGVWKWPGRLPRYPRNSPFMTVWRMYQMIACHAASPLLLCWRQAVSGSLVCRAPTFFCMRCCTCLRSFPKATCRHASLTHHCG